jgi:hypothetical protein
MVGGYGDLELLLERRLAEITLQRRTPLVGVLEQHAAGGELFRPRTAGPRASVPELGVDARPGKASPPDAPVNESAGGSDWAADKEFRSTDRQTRTGTGRERTGATVEIVRASTGFGIHEGVGYR